MVLGWFSGTKEATVGELVAAKKYKKALELLRKQFKEGSRDPGLRLQLADVLVLSGHTKEAVPILTALADEYARAGFAAKAIAVLKKLQKVAPGKPEVERRLAELLHKKIAIAPAAAPSRSAAAPMGSMDFGMEEIGAEIGAGELEIGASIEPVSAPATAPAPVAPAVAAPKAAPAAAPAPAATAPAAPAAPAPAAAKPPTAPAAPPAAVARPAAVAPVAGAARPATAPAAAAAPAPAPPAAGSPAPGASELGDEAEFLGLLDDLDDIVEATAADEEPAPGAAAPAPAQNPLFSAFLEDELQAVIARFQLISFAPGDIVVSEGQPGDSLFVLTTGHLKAFVRDQSGRNVPLRDLPEGSFFGEVSILTGQPRSATITCVTECELLELDRKSLEEISAQHPRVRDVIRETYGARAGSLEEMLAREGWDGPASSKPGANPKPAR